jgi:anti-sigma-K factor RskA
MNCDQLREHYELYALGIAEEPERGEIRDHLNRGCEVCGAGVKRALETTALLGASAPAAQPSPQLRRRILASVGLEPRRFGLAWAPVWAMAALLLVVAAYFTVSNRRYADDAARLRDQSARLRDQMRAQTAEIVRLTEAFAILSGPSTTEASFGGQQPRPPHGKVFVSPSRGVLLIASNLPRTAADKIYEMWIIPKGAKPVPAGLFQSQDDGSAMHVRSGTVDMASTAAIAVTVENQAGADQPTTKPLIVAQLSGATP